MTSAILRLISKYAQAAIGAVVACVGAADMVMGIGILFGWDQSDGNVLGVFALAAGLLSSGVWIWHTLNRFASPDPGRCARCSYDLTGNVSGVCPECGTKVGTA